MTLPLTLLGCYYQHQGRQIGPVSRQELQGLLDTGEVLASDEVLEGWRNGEETNMDRSVQGFIGLAALLVTALMAFGAYRWTVRQRRGKVEAWVRRYLVNRYGETPAELHIDCSDDRRWPVVVTFRAPQTGARHRLRFACGGAVSSFALASETEDERPFGVEPPVGVPTGKASEE